MNNSLEQRIRSLVPELMELTLGCKVRLSSALNNAYDEIFLRKDSNYYYFLNGDKFEYRNKTYEDAVIKMSFEIIGHEIHPHHWFPLLVGDYVLQIDGQILKDIDNEHYGWYSYETGIRTYYPKYDFKKSFSEQSPEFHQWLEEQLFNNI